MNRHKFNVVSSKLFVIKKVAENNKSFVKNLVLKNLSKKHTIPGDGLLRRSNTDILLRLATCSSLGESLK